MGVYSECVRNKELAAKVMLLLIGFEFGLLGDDKPIKGKNPYLGISMRGFREIYNIAGPFADPRKDRWAQLLLKRAGNVGGYRGGEPSTEDKVLDFLKRNLGKRWRIE